MIFIDGAVPMITAICFLCDPAHFPLSSKPENAAGLILPAAFSLLLSVFPHRDFFQVFGIDDFKPVFPQHPGKYARAFNQTA